MICRRFFLYILDINLSLDLTIAHIFPISTKFKTKSFHEKVRWNVASLAKNLLLLNILQCPLIWCLKGYDIPKEASELHVKPIFVCSMLCHISAVLLEHLGKIPRIHNSIIYWLFFPFCMRKTGSMVLLWDLTICVSFLVHRPNLSQGKQTSSDHFLFIPLVKGEFPTLNRQDGRTHDTWHWTDEIGCHILSIQGVCIPHEMQGHMGMAFKNRVNQQGLWEASFGVMRGGGDSWLLWRNMICLFE